MQLIAINLQGFGRACSRSHKMPAAFAALNAMTGDDRSQRSADPVAHRAAHATALGRLIHFNHRLLPDTKARKNHA